MQTKPSKPEYKPVLDNGRSTFSIIKGPINGDNRHETVFFRLLDTRTGIGSFFQELENFVEEAIQEGEVVPEDKEELIRECRVVIAKWFRR